MARTYLVNIDLKGNQFLNARVHNASASPTGLGKGQLWYDSTGNLLNVFNGTTFDTLGVAGGGIPSLNGLTGALTIYGTANQITVAPSSSSIVLSLDTTHVATDTNVLTLSNKTLSSPSVTGTLVNSGSISGGVIVNANHSSGSISGTLTNTGTISGGSVSGATLVGTTTNSGTINGGSVTAAYISTSGDLQVGGNLYYSGSVTIVAGSTVITQDPLLYISNNNLANLFDIGFVGSFTSGTQQWTGLVRDHNVTNTWRLTSNLPVPGNASVNFASATYDTLALGGLTVYSSSTNVSASITGAGFVTAPSANFTSALQLGGSAVATQSFVTAQGYLTNASTPNFTGASVGGVAVGRKLAFTLTGDNTTTSFVVNHGLGTRDVVAQLYQTSAGPDTQYAEVLADIVRTSTASVTVAFATAPANTTTYNLVIIG